MGVATADLAAGEDGQYVDAAGNKAYIGWSIPLDWLGGYSLLDYAGYMTEETYNLLSVLPDADGYIALTEETFTALAGLTASDDWGNEAPEDLVNYIYCENGVMEPTGWDQVGYVEDDTYTFTLILKNPSSLFDLESNIGSLILVKEDLYEANKVETGGIIKSSYGTAVDKFSAYGPYKIVSYQESKEIRFERNESWFGYSDERYEGQYQTTGIVLQQIDEHPTQMQYLFYMLVRLFSSREKRYAQKKDYYTYCTEKKARLEAEGPSPIKKAMLLEGLVCFALALGFVLAYYRMV